MPGSDVAPEVVVDGVEHTLGSSVTPLLILLGTGHLSLRAS
ncbi:MAG: hypothetical protein WCH91_13935 [bacterium]